MGDRIQAVSMALSLLGIPYRWDGKDPERDGGLDCSGFAQLVLQAAGVSLPEENAETLWATLPDPGEHYDPLPGDLAFYGANGKATHVMVVLGPHGNTVIGSHLGDKPYDGETPEAYAQRMHRAQAGVSIVDWRHEGMHYRADFLGVRSLDMEAR